MATWDVNTGSLGAKLRLIVDLVSQDADANESVVRVRLQLVSVPTSTFKSDPVACNATGPGFNFATTFTWTAGTTSKTLIDIERTVDHDAVGTFSKDFAGGIGATGTSGIGGATSTGLRTVTLPTLTVVPGTPTACTAVRVSDAAMTVSWAQSSASNGAPVTNTIRQRVNGGAWSNVATISPATSASVGSATNQKLEYAVKGTNAAGDSAWSATSAAVYTTPAAPSAVTATKDSAQDITVAWTPNVAFTEHQHVVEVSTDGGSSWSSLATVSAGTSSYKHVGPNPALIHRYRVRARNTSTGNLTSAWVQSNSVQLLAAPAAPTVTALPDFADKAATFRFAWTHNPIDTTPQTKFQVRYSLNGGSSWTTGSKTTSANQFLDFAGSTWTADQTVTFQVRTKGSYDSGSDGDASYSPWSDSETVTFKTKPVATITTPADSSTWEQAELDVALGFSQAESASFVQATIQLFEGATLLETRVSTTLASTVLETQVDDGGSYMLSVTVLDSNGLTSAAVESDFTVDYTLPVAAGVELTYNAESGVMQIAVTIAAAGMDEAEAVAVSISRVIDGARESLFTAYPVEVGEITFLDTTPTIHGLNEYRVRTISADGATADTEDTLATDEGVMAFLSTGDGFGNIVSFGADLTVNATPARSSALVPTAGRAKAIALFGTNTSLRVGGSAEIIPDMGSTPAEIEQFLLDAGVTCYRDPTGRRVFGRVSGSIDSPSSLSSSFTFSVDEAS